MIRAKKGDIPKLISILTESFEDNKSANFAVKNKKSLPELFKYSVAKGFLCGDVWLNDDKTACAILLDPKKKKSGFQSVWLDLTLVFNVVGLFRIKKVRRKENITEQTLPHNIDYIHLWFLGVEPKMQGNGIGTSFLQELIQFYKSSKEAICLETSTLVNIPFYEKQGFSRYATKYFGFEFFFYIKQF
ncbi:GNAT family N-acetyltransferase [Chryseobacterium shandongense]|jgi:ribosomal protein S18 acetylase RimI-like enzyme|uniref:GNAT family N-acetyltransferase n=1 Tax=Chryseobacterium shandongense TaxID=1493872 RepID=UPI000F4EDDDF|nr:GNAT family N-acetyltransferase [Chryseobacterium shandongense]AZA58209.1 N-acetyltransferase [Chryseobacterium shandongense]